VPEGGVVAVVVEGLAGELGVLDEGLPRRGGQHVPERDTARRLRHAEVHEAG
jgi:hypothetical protein